MPLLVLVRHGQSTWNLENRFTGEENPPLTPQGREEAHSAGKKLKMIGFTRGYTSVLHRAIETMILIQEETNQPEWPVFQDRALNERNYGQLQGLNKSDVGRYYGDDQVALWRRSYSVRPPGGESLADTASRVIPYYRRAVEPWLRQGQPILIVAHGNSLRALMMHLEQLDDKEISDVDLPTGIPRRYILSDSLQLEDVKYL